MPLTILLAIIFIFFVQNCFSVGLFDCYGPGCSKEWCNNYIFIPLYLPYVVFFILLMVVHSFVSIIFNLINFYGSADPISFTISHVLMMPVYYLLSVGLVKALESVIKKLKS